MTQVDLLNKFKSELTKNGKYALLFNTTGDKYTRVRQVPHAVKPFEIIYKINRQPYVIVKCVSPKKDGTNLVRLFLINYNTGVVNEHIPHGSYKIVYDKRTNDIYTKALDTNSREPVMKITCLSGISSSNSSRLVMPYPDKVDVLAFTNAASGDQISVIGLTDNKTQENTITNAPKKRGRPKGSKNKPKTSTPAKIRPATVPAAKKSPALEKPAVQRTPAAETTPIAPAENPTSVSAMASIANKAATAADEINVVTIQPISGNINNGEYNVFINNIRVAQKYINASARTFMDGKILAISYDLPAERHTSHDIFMPNAKKLVISMTDKFTKRPVKIYDISESAKGLRLEMSNNAVKVIRPTDLNRYKNAVFLIKHSRSK